MHLLFTQIIIITVAVDALSMRIEEPATTPIIGQPFGLKCCANKTIQNMSELTLKWYHNNHIVDHDHGNFQEIDGENICLTINFTSLLPGNEGEYTCRVALQSSTMEDMLVQEENFTLVALVRG